MAGQPSSRAKPFSKPAGCYSAGRGSQGTIGAALALCLALATLTFAGAGCRQAHPATNPAPWHAPQRIVSLAPSLTEVAFALGLGDRVVGVTRHCAYPPEAATKAKVGGFLDAGAESVLALEPDLVLVPPTSGDLADRLHGLGVNCVVINQFTVSDIFNSIDEIGRLCGVEPEAQTLAAEIRARLARVERAVGTRARPRVLVSVGRDYAAPGLDNVYVAAGNSFYGELVALAGGENAYRGETFAYPTVSMEGLMALNPEVILEVVPDPKKQGVTEGQVRSAWQTLPELAAVKSGRIHVLQGDFVGIPGPRLARIVEDMAALLHPEVRFDAAG